MSRESHDDSGHVLVASGNGYAGVMVLSTCYSLDTVGDDFASLEGEAHA